MMHIHFLEKDSVFVLETEKTMYQMQIADYGILLHLYYGKKVGDTLITHRIVKKDRGFSGNPFEADDDRTFSLDVLPQEYPGAGNGDYRSGALELEHADGSSAADLRYVSHKIYPGKYCLEGLPASFAKEGQAETLELTLRDASGVEAILYYGVFPEDDMITRAVKICNQGSQKVVVKRAMSFSMDFADSRMDCIHLPGRYGMERQAERQKLHPGMQSFGSVRGTSSHQHNPFFILCARNATEDYGDSYGFSLMYSGNFLAELETDSMNQTRVSMGIHPYHFSFGLLPGEEFITPELLLSYSGEGLTALSQNYHDFLRSHVCRGRYADRPRPVLVNNWEATYFDFDEEKLYHIAEKAKEIGIEMLVMDDGWFGKRDKDTSGLGDWRVNTGKLKGGLPKLAERIHRLGLKFGIWVEPEMISEDSDLFREHPDWCMRIPGRGYNRSRCQLNLDITRKEVRDAIMSRLFEVFDGCGIAYVKWDMNRSLSNVYSQSLPPEKQGEVYHRYVLGLYEMQERLTQRYPDLLLENCSGGGGRFDPGMLYYSPQIWCSDNTDAVERLKIQYGTSFGYPISAIGAHVSVCPNHQTGRVTPFDTRGIVAMSGSFGYELDLEKLSPEEKELAKAQVETYHRLAPLVISGDYYRLNSPYGESRYAVWQMVSKQKEKSVVMGVQVRPECNAPVEIIRLKGLEPKAHYQLNGRRYTGAALMYAGIPLPDVCGTDQSFLYELEQFPE